MFRGLDKETKAKMKVVDEYFKELVRKKRYDNTKSAYVEFWNKMLETVGADETEPMVMKVAKVAEFIKYLERVGNYEHTE